MNTYAVYFKPLTPLASWPLGSDTLAGAVCWGIRLLGLMDDDALSHWLEKQKDQPRFASVRLSRFILALRNPFGFTLVLPTFNLPRKTTQPSKRIRHTTPPKP